MGKQITCSDCTYRLDDYQNGRWCLMSRAIMGSTEECSLKEIGDPLLERIKKIDRALKNL